MQGTLLLNPHKFTMQKNTRRDAYKTRKSSFPQKLKGALRRYLKNFETKSHKAEKGEREVS